MLTSFLLLISTNVLFMKNSNNNIGTIDTLMIARAVLEREYTTIKREIGHHQFIVEREINNRNVRAINPYRITHYCSRDDDSALGDQVFDRIDKINAQQMTLEIKNTFNQKPNALDECTRWKKTENSDKVLVIAAFCDKKSLIVALKTLRNLEKK